MIRVIYHVLIPVVVIVVIVVVIILHFLYWCCLVMCVSNVTVCVITESASRGRKFSVVGFFVCHDACVVAVSIEDSKAFYTTHTQKG